MPPDLGGGGRASPGSVPCSSFLLEVTWSGALRANSASRRAASRGWRSKPDGRRKETHGTQAAFASLKEAAPSLFSFLFCQIALSYLQQLLSFRKLKQAGQEL